jgi:hypothetical protein
MSTTSHLIVALCILCSMVAQTSSTALVCALCNKATCPLVNCSAGTVYDGCNCCQICGLPPNHTCDVRGTEPLYQRYCAEGLVCELNETTGQRFCKGMFVNASHSSHVRHPTSRHYRWLQRSSCNNPLRSFGQRLRRFDPGGNMDLFFHLSV